MTILAVLGGIILSFVGLYFIYAVALLGLFGFDTAPPWYIRLTSVLLIVGTVALWWFLVGSHVTIGLS